LSDKRPVPARVDSLDRRAVERVLARAAELQATRGSGPDTTELISETQLVEIAFEAGLDSAWVKQALAEERTHIPEASETGAVARTFGAGRIAAGRTIEGSATELLAALDRWMQKEECMRLQRRFPERMVWEPSPDVWSQLRRGFGLGSGTFSFARADTVSATAVDLGGGRSLVAMEADISGKRAPKLRGGAAFAGAGVATAAALLGLGVVIPIAAIFPLAGGSALGWAVARSHRDLVAKMQLALEQTLDKLEYGEARRPPGMLANVISSATRHLLR
jgi:hypothetical protein